MPTSDRCIWCLKRKAETQFDICHVLPECVGNENIQVLPEFAVCKQCNNYFGSKVEPALLRDPLFHIIAVFLRLRDPQDMNEFRDRIFDREHPTVGNIKRKLYLGMKISLPRTFSVDVHYGIRGQINKSYERKELALLSRAVHKIAFETLAWTIFTQNMHQDIDVFSADFDSVRQWARHGAPINTIRPVIRRQTFDRISTEWGCCLATFPDFIAMELNLFGDWYAVSLTSAPDKAKDDLVKSLPSQRPDYPIWLLGEEFLPLS